MTEECARHRRHRQHRMLSMETRPRSISTAPASIYHPPSASQSSKSQTAVSTTSCSRDLRDNNSDGLTWPVRMVLKMRVVVSSYQA
ncbi:hypothetical protein CPB84DRAFT_1383445 [Gymnopilus junonius]|uniref:Uncharacterized protein n=1 Tax=Gymnopilus junonius TaxID=109634 RepID=A0A9P5NKI7_GYMJU|nr:hypothetical protein CPB84DRAFT_1383445 [Gymnopilus junonius]